MAHGPPVHLGVDPPAGLTVGWWARRCDQIADRMDTGNERSPPMPELAAEWRAFAARVRKSGTDGN